MEAPQLNQDCLIAVLATQVLALQPSSFGARANAVPARAPALCLPSGQLDLCPLLRRCAALERLSLAGLHRIASDELLRTVAASCPRLQELVLDFCGGVTRAGLEHVQALVEGAPGLRCLSLRRCAGLGSVAALARLSRLEDLDLSYCARGSAAALAGSRGVLRRLCLHGCEGVGDEVCGQLPLVEELVVAFTAVTDKGLAALAAGSPQLRTLVLAKRSYNMWQTGLWTDEGLAAFKAAAPRAKVVLISC
ncbi:hypothetical protein ABPG75_006793 [Micractinium tetrahymenae]